MRDSRASRRESRQRDVQTGLARFLAPVRFILPSAPFHPAPHSSNTRLLIFLVENQQRRCNAQNIVFDNRPKIPAVEGVFDDC